MAGTVGLVTIKKQDKNKSCLDHGLTCHGLATGYRYEF